MPLTIKERSPVPVISLERWQREAEGVRGASVPVMIRDVFTAQARSWSPQAFRARWPDKSVRVTVNLPRDGVPYLQRAEAHERTLSVSAFADLLDTGTACYLNQMPITEFPELAAELDLSALRLSRLFSVNLWLGGQTKSGLHFDNADNFFGQIYGRKRALLISPTLSKRLYPLSDNPSKSAVNPEDPDLTKFPAFAECQVFEANLAPGDALYMPRGWWHYIAAEDVSISVNCWHGDTLGDFERTKLLLAGGHTILLRTLRDFVWHGVFGRPFQQRLFSPPPLGIELYRLVRSRLRRA